MQLMGQDYLTHLMMSQSPARVSPLVLMLAEKLGTSPADCFSKWDVDGGGSISTAELEVRRSVGVALVSTMEWNGMEWNGMEWNGMEWNGMECSRVG